MTESSTHTDRERLTTDQIAYPQGDQGDGDVAYPRDDADRAVTEPVVAGQVDTSRTGTDPTGDPVAAPVGTGESAARGPSSEVTGESGRPAASDAPSSPAQLLDSGELAGITRRWSDIQAAFVDAPQQAVQDADALVADLMQHLAQVFASERQQLESQWSRGGSVSTEELRVSLQRYRSFFQRLLSV